MKKLTVLIFLAVLASNLVVPLLANDEQPSQLLSDQEMHSLIAGSCDKAAGIMTGFAFSSGYVFAINPVVSLSFLAAAGAVGIGIALVC